MAPIMMATFEQVERLAEKIQLVQSDRQSAAGGPGSKMEQAPAPSAVPSPLERHRCHRDGRQRRHHYSSSRSPSSSSRDEDLVDAAAVAVPANPPVVPDPREAPKVIASAV